MDPQALDAEFHVEFGLFTEDRHDLLREKLEAERRDDAAEHGHADRHLDRLLHAVQVPGAVIEADDRQRAGRNAVHDRNQDVVDLHCNAHRRQRNIRSILRQSAPVDQELVRHDDDDHD